MPPGCDLLGGEEADLAGARRQLEHLVAGLELERVDHPHRDRHRRGGQPLGLGAPAARPGRPSGRGSPCGSRRERSCQLAPQQLARGGARELVRQLERLRHLVAREPLGAVLAQLRGGRRGSRRAARCARSPTRPSSDRARPKTPASATAGCSSSTASTSAGATFSPPETIVSLLRPMTVRRPSSSSRPRSPVRSVSHAPTTVGPLTKISPSAGDAARRCPGSGRPAVSRSPGLGERDRRARLGEPVGLGDREARLDRALEQRRAARGRRPAAPAAGAGPGGRRRRAARASIVGTSEASVMSPSRSSRATRSASKGGGSSTTVPAAAALRTSTISPPTCDSGIGHSQRSSGSEPEHGPGGAHVRGEVAEGQLDRARRARRARRCGRPARARPRRGRRC